MLPTTMKHTGLDSQPTLTFDHPASIQWMVSKNVAILWGQWDLFRFKVNGSTLRWPETTKWNNSPRLHTAHLLFLYQRSVYHTGSTTIASWDFLLQQPQRLTYIFHTVPDTVNAYTPACPQLTYLFLYNTSCFRCQPNVIPDSEQS